MKYLKHINFTKITAVFLTAVMVLTGSSFMSDMSAFANRYNAADDWSLVLVNPGSQVADSGDSLQFDAVVVASDGETVKNPNIKWSVDGFYDYGDLPVSADTAVDSDGFLVIAENEAVPGLTVTATYVGENSVEYIGTAVVRLPNNEMEEDLYYQEGSIEEISSNAEELTLSAVVDVDLARAACYTAEEGNIARLASVRQLTNTGTARYNPLTGEGVDRTGINASYNNDSYGAPATQILRVTDGVRPTSGTSNGYLSWAYVDNFGVNNRLYFILNWGQPHTIGAVRCDWWTDSNVSVPNSEARVEWLDGTVWREVTNMVNPVTGATVANIGTLGMGNWNAVTFDPVVTSQLRLRLFRTGTITNGIGVGEWEVFEAAGEPELRSVSIAGSTGMVVNEESEYSANVVNVGLEGLEYKWTVDDANIAEIVGGDAGSTVKVRGVNGGNTNLRVTVKHDSGVLETSASFSITVTGPVSGVQMRPTHVFVKPGSESAPFTASATTTVANLKGVVWSIQGEAVEGVSIDANTGVLKIGENVAIGARFKVRAAAAYNGQFYADAAVTVADMPGAASPNGYYNSVHRDPYTGATYGADAVIADMKSSGVWGRTATNGSVTGGTDYDWTTTNNRYGTDTRYVYEGGYGNGDAMYTGSSNTGSNYRLISGTTPDAQFAIYEGNGNVDTAYADIDYTVGMRVPANQTGGIVFRYQDFQNYYYLKVAPSGPAEDRIIVGKIVDGADTVLHRSNGTANADTWYDWRIRLVGNNLRVLRHTNFRWQSRWTAVGDNITFAAGTSIFDNVTLDADETFAAGKAGIWAVNGSGAAFSHIAIGNLDNNYKIKGDTWTLTTGSYGNIKQLTADTLLRSDPATTAVAALRDDPNGAKLQILGNEDVNRDEMGFNRHLGELKFAYTKGASDTLITARTGESEDIRRAVFDPVAQRVDFIYDFESQNPLGIKDFSVVNSYSIKKENGVEFVQYDIVVKNTSDENIEFYDIGMPITWNNHWQGDSAYKYNMGGANEYVSYHGSYITLERTDGRSQKIVFMPDQSTDAKLEYRRYQGAGSDSNMPQEFFIYSKGVANRAPKAAWVNNNYNPDQSYIPNTTSGTVAPGEERKYSFRIFITDAKNHLEIDDILVSQGSVASVVKPGMITPISQDVEVNLRTLSSITKIEDITPDPDPRNGVQKRTGVPNPIAGWYAYNGNPRAIATFNAEKTAKVNAQNGNQEAHIYNIEFKKLGRNDIKVYYEVGGQERWTVLQFWVTADVADAIQLRATYLVEKSFVSDEFYADYLAGGERRAALNAAPDNHYNTADGRAFVERHKYAFLETNNIFGYVRGHNGDNYYCTNSVHEQCVDNIAFLANKNVNYPVYKEMKAMEQGFIDHFYTLQVRNFGSPQSTGAGSAGQEGTLWAGCGCYVGNYWGSTGTTAATSRITRGFNYQNLAAAFWSMYEATRRNPQILGDEARWEPVDYLKVAAILAYRGMFIDNAPAGHMNDWALKGIYDGLVREAALGNEGTVAEASGTDGRTYRSCANLLTLFTTQATTRGNNFYNAAYPFSSEFAYDQTGEEGAYTLINWFSSLGNDDAAYTRLDKMTQTIGKAIAWTGKQPVWHHQAMGNVAGNEHWMYKYSVGHHSQILNDFFFNHADRGIYMTEGVARYDGNNQFSQDIWRFTYPMKMAVAGWIFSGQPELHGPTGPNAANPTGGLVNKNPMVDGLGILGSVMGAMRTARPYDWSLEDAYTSNYNGFPYSESAEADEGIWACLNVLSADIVPNDPNFGLAGWGAKVSDNGAAYEVIPTDGLYRKLNIVGDRFQTEFIHDRYTKAVINKNYIGAKFDIENVAGKAHTGTVNLRMLQPGTYNVLVDGKQQRQVVVPYRSGDALDRYGNVIPVEFTYDASEAAVQTLEIIYSDFSANVEIATQGNVAKADFNVVSPIGGANVSGTLLLAVYDEAGRMEELYSMPFQVTGGAVVSEQLSGVIPERGSAKAFIWDAVFVPLCEAAAADL